MNIQHRTFNAQHPMVGRVTSAVAWLWRDKPCAPQTKIREQPASANSRHWLLDVFPILQNNDNSKTPLSHDSNHEN
jgi:hypothetical protein